MQITRLDHLVLTVADPAATVDFYVKLGMRAETFEDGRVTLHFGEQKLNVHSAGAEITPHATRPTPGSADICFLVEASIEDIAAELRTAGLTVDIGPVERTGAQGRLMSLYLRDPDSNLIELSEQLDGSTL